MFDCLYEMIQQELGGSASETLDILHRRLAHSAVNDVSAAILEVDEAVELLERSDVRVLYQEQQDVRREKTSRQSFADAYRERRRTLAMKCPGRRGSRAKSVLPKLGSQVDQKLAKSLLPPGASIWRGLTRGQWCGHLQPYARVSRPWAGDESAACLQVIRELWDQFLEMTGQDWSACTVEGLEQFQV